METILFPTRMEKKMPIDPEQIAVTAWRPWRGAIMNKTFKGDIGGETKEQKEEEEE